MLLLLALTFASALADDDSYSFSSYFYNGSAEDSGCDVTNPCIRKCCGVNYVPVHKQCVLNATGNLWRFLETSNLTNGRLLPGIVRCESDKHYLLNGRLYFDDAFVLEEDGRLFLPHSKELFERDEFCMDHFENVGVSALVCFSATSFAVTLWTGIRITGMIISMPFLLITFLVYAVLPDRNLHGKCLMCYVITLFCAYALLIFIQLYPIAIEVRACKTLGILCLFFFMVSFFWMNVMSIDICWTFSGMRGFSGSRKEAERKRFLVYCGYAWGMPFLLAMMVTGLSISADSDMNAWYNPGMGDGQCWFRDGIPTMLYFYLPMALLIIINLTLFCTTACKIKRVQQDTAMLRKDESNKQSYESDKQRFNLYLKLLLAMGVNWSMEIISWIVDWQIGQVPPPVWYITDFCNALYGVFIFFIFVFKQNIWKLLKRRYYMVIGKPSLARSMTQSAYSPRTTGSSLNHTVSNDKSYVNDSSVLTSEVA